MATCPICSKAPGVEAYKPFCSRRCADVDLQRWLSGAYVLPDMEDRVPDADPDDGP